MNMLTSIVISVTLSLALLAGYHHHFAAKSIVQVDINHIVDNKIKALSNNGLTEVENKQAIQAFGRELEQTIIHVAKDNDLIVLPSQAVITGSPDYTDVINRSLNP